MENILFRSPKSHYEADAAIVWCFDNRFWQLLLAFVKERGLKWFDPVILAGGAKSLASANEEGKAVMEQIQASIRSHHAPRVILMTHSDCSGYGGLQAFGNDPAAERAKHKEDLERAAAAVRTAVPESVSVETYFADFDGIRAV